MSKTIAIRGSRGKPLDSYMHLVNQFPLRPLRTVEQYQAAGRLVDTLAVRGEQDLDEGEADYLAVLSNLIEAYDDAYHRIPSDSRKPHEKLQALLVEQNLTHAKLADILGVARSLASLVTTGKRQITANHARKLGARFKVNPGYFL